MYAKSNRVLSTVSIAVGLGSGFSLACLLFAIESFAQRSLSQPTPMPAVSRAPPLAFDMSTADDQPPPPTQRPVRILCWILTGPSNHLAKAQHVRHTWGRHCDRLLFMSSQADARLPGSVALAGVDEGRDQLWAKTRRAFAYIHQHHRHEADWFLKADDDTFVVMDNLRLLLHGRNASEPQYFGHLFGARTRLGKRMPYMSGGSGYVLSGRALDAFVERALADANQCRPEASGSEDMHLGRCLAFAGVRAGDSRDASGRERFFPLALTTHAAGAPALPDWYAQYSWHSLAAAEAERQRNGRMVTANAIAFHYVRPRWMHLIEYLLFGVRLAGRSQTMLE